MGDSTYSNDHSDDGGADRRTPKRRDDSPKTRSRKASRARDRKRKGTGLIGSHRRRDKQWNW